MPFSRPTPQIWPLLLIARASSSTHPEPGSINEFRFDGDPLYGRNALPAAPNYFARGELIYRSPRGWHVGPMLDVVDVRARHRDGTRGIYLHDPFGNAVELICYPPGKTVYDRSASEGSDSRGT